MGNHHVANKSMDYQINNSIFKAIKNSYCLQDHNILQFYEYYQHFDQYQRSFIDFDDFVEYFKRDISDFVELPYAEQLFISIPKEKQGMIFFEEFVKGISAFCLLNKESLLRFIFDCMDTDENQKISKKDMMQFVEYTQPLTGEYCFYTNFIADIESFPLKQGQTKIDFDNFRLNYTKLLFLVWPAFSLQEYLRKNIFGIDFWYELYSKVEKKEIQYKNNEKKQQRMKEKIYTLKRLKQKSSHLQPNTMKQNINKRKPKQVSDDCRALIRNRRQHRRSVPYQKKQLYLQNFQQRQRNQED